jgi:glycosyltransferase involved in cell wall biosynthesis
MTQDPKAKPMSLNTPRVCIVAEHASFSFGGEASLPLHYFARLRQRGIEAWLIVHSRTQRELQTRFPEDQDRIEYIPDRWYHKAIWQWDRLLPRRISQATSGLLMILINQVIQRRMVRRLIRSRGINVVHQPIPVSPKAPSFFWGLNVPVIIGPMNGGMDYPEAFKGAESLTTRAVVSTARLAARFANRVIAGKRHASVLLVANERTRLALACDPHGSVVEIPENGVDLTIWSPPQVNAASGAPSRFVFVGRLVDWKRLDIVVKALVTCPGAVLEVIGDGPMRGEWAALAATLGVAERIHWLGWLPQPDCAKRLHSATALVLPSIYECGGAVVLEALACAVPVIALDWGGPAEYVNASCGILIPPSNEESIVQGFSEAQRLLANDPVLRTTLGDAGRKRVEQHYDWNQKVDQIVTIYRISIAESLGKTAGVSESV